jgi:hypothetical protein
MEQELRTPLRKRRSDQVLNDVGKPVKRGVRNFSHRPRDSRSSEGPQSPDDPDILDFIKVKFKGGKGSKISESEQMTNPVGSRLYIFATTDYRSVGRE